MYAITNLKLKKKYGIENGKERETLYAAVNEWVRYALSVIHALTTAEHRQRLLMQAVAHF